MNCEEFKNQILDYLENLLSESDKHKFESHLQQCALCKSQFDEFSQMQKQLEEDAKKFSQKDLQNRVMQQIHREQGSKFISNRKFTAFKKVGLGIAAVILIGLTVISIYVANYTPDPQNTIVIGQTCLYSENSAPMRILVRNYVTDQPIEGATVLLELKGDDDTYELGNFTTGPDGCISNAIYVPPVTPGKYTLVIKSESKVGKDLIERQIEVKRPYRLYITTDKPVYQPGQTLHMRAMVLNRVSLKPFAHQDIVFEIEDPKGNKVHRTEMNTSEYGIASADFEIASEVNLGRYRIRAIVGDVESETVVAVKHYVLPKFRVDISTDKSYYLPSEQISGVIKALYFFGKPVAHAHVEIFGQTIVEEPTEIFRLTGHTNENGELPFHTQLADYFTGMPLAGGNAFLQIEVTVTDTAAHKETSSEHCVVAQQPINIHVLPESGDLVSGVENLIYLMTAYPDGQPAQCQIDANGSLLTTDETGIAVFSIVPRSESVSLQITAKDKTGKTGTLIQEVQLSTRSQTFLLRTDKAVYSGGQTVQVTVLSTAPKVTLFLDIIKDKQTILTRTIPVENSRGDLVIDLPPGIFGTLKVNVYTITADGQSISDSRIIYVQQSNQLHIDTSLDKSVYKPGETARINFVITDTQGRPTPAALGLSVVDEAVFYISENRPGLLEQFFLVDQELLRPAYQIKFAVSPSRLLSGNNEDQTLALAILSAAAQPVKKTVNLDHLEEYLGPDMLEEIEELRREGMLDQWLDSPQYAHLADILRAEEDYTLRATTYQYKVDRAETLREKYFDFLKTGFFVLLILGIVGILIGAILYSVYCLVKQPSVGDLNEMQKVIQKTANGILHSFSFLFFLPIITYPAVAFLSEITYEFDFDDTIWFVFAINAIITTILIAKQLGWSLALTGYPESAKFVKKVIYLPIIFLIQYLCTRTMFIYIATDLIDEDYIIVIILITILASLSIYLLASMTANKLAKEFHVHLRHPRSFATAAIITVIIAFMASIMMPALGRARELAQSVAARSMLHGLDMAVQMFEGEHPITAKTQGKEQSVRIRKYFPETLLWQPELITDEQGRATLDLKTADSITTWRMSINAVSAVGELGSSETGVRVFQDFFVDLDLPVTLTRNDEISLPILCYNYLEQTQTVKLTLEADSWYELQGPSQQEVKLAPSEVKSVMFRIKAKDVGTHNLTLMAHGEKLSDAIQRSVNVRPDGSEIEDLQNAILTKSAIHTFFVPSEAIRNSQSLVLNLYPSTFSEVVEGLDNIFRMPYGCFEQTSSTTYPNVMALQYMQRTKQVTPEVEIKARKFITAGYQRLLTFEVAGGGFDWFGHPPANEMLTAYGILEFTDMAEVHHVDQAVIDRAKKWLLSKQDSDGSWKPNRWAHTLDAVNSEVMATAYIAWALAEAGQKGSEMFSALNHLRQHLGSTDQAYTTALAANAFLAHDERDSFGRELVSRLHSQFVSEGKLAYITSSGSGAMYSRGRCLDIETTALATLAMMKATRYPETTKKALTWISQQKDQFGTWHSTQATILAMKALITGTSRSLGSDTPSDIEITVNGQLADKISITPNTSDLLYMVSLTKYLKSGENDIRIISSQDTEITYRLVGTYWVPTKTTTSIIEKELEILVNYDKSRLAVDDVLTCNVEVRRNGQTPVNMAIIDLGIPPGFKVDTSAFQRLVETRTLAKYELTGNQCILYVRNIEPGRPIRFNYELKALYPIRAKIPPTEVYEYYRPENRDRTSFFDIEVTKQII